MTASITYFWIAEFADGTALPQFDPDTGKENKANPNWLSLGSDIPPNSIFNKRVVKIGWYPFPPALAQKIKEVNCIAVNNPPYKISVGETEFPHLKREVEIAQFTFRQCNKCQSTWQYAKPPVQYIKELFTKKGKLHNGGVLEISNPEKEGQLSSIGFLISTKSYVEAIETTTEKGAKLIFYVSSICPFCGYHDTNAVMMKDKQVFRKKGQVVTTVYYLGIHNKYQIKIYENGRSEVIK